MKWLKATTLCTIGTGTVFAVPEIIAGWFGSAGAIAMIPGAGLTVVVLAYVVSALWKL